MSITSDELNFLVYRYLQESGFVHSAFVFAYESLVGRANLASADIPPGALINFLQKGLQFVEIEKELEQRASGGELQNGLSILSGTKDSEISAIENIDAMEVEKVESKTSQIPKTTLDIQGKSKVNQNDMLVALSDVTELKGHKSDVLTCAWNPKGDILCSGSNDSTVRIWVIPRGASGLPAGSSASETPIILNHAAEGAQESSKIDVTSVDWHPDGQLIATGSFEGHARIWNVDGSLIHTLKSHTSTVIVIQWNKSGTMLLSGSTDTNAVVWDAEQGSVLQVFTEHKSPILGVDWVDDKTFATCSTDMLVHIYKLGENEPLHRLEGHTGEVNSVRWNPNGTLLASCSDDHITKIWNASDGKCILDLAEHKMEVFQIVWSPVTEKCILASASKDHTVKVWDAQVGKCLHNLEGHTDQVYTIAFSHDGKFIASGSMDHSVRIWNVETGVCLKRYEGGGCIFEVSWNKDSNKVAACSGVPAKSVCVIDFRG